MSKNKVFVVALTSLLVSPNVLAMAQIPVMAASEQTTQVAQTYQKPLPPVGKPAASFSLTDGTPLKLKLKESISSKTAQENDGLEFEVAEDVKIQNIIVIAKGAPATGIVTEATKGKMLGRKGKLSIAVKEVTLTSGERIPIRAQKSAGGGLSAGVIAATVVLTPIFLLMGGSNVTYKAGTELTAFIDGNYVLEPAKFSATSR